MSATPSAQGPSQRARDDASVPLELALGDPCVAANPLSHARVVEGDEAERFPQEDVAALQALGYARFCSPASWESGQVSFEVLLESTRAVARRDLTSAVVLGQTMLGSLPVLLAGDASQRARLARYVEQGALGSLALTEEQHGSDLASTTLTAELGAGGFELGGAKWLIGNMTHSCYMSVLARQREATPAEPALGGVRSVLLFLDKRDLAAGCYRYLPRLYTHGVRGTDLAGVSFDRCLVPGSSRIGTESGFDLVAKTLQISRVFCAGLSLGAGDSALRIALDFATNRRLYGRSVLEIGAARDTLARAGAQLMIGEVLAWAGHRAIGLAPELLPLWSPMLKCLVPALGEEVIRGCGSVLGARSYLRSALHCGLFQKIVRDHAVVGLFDGSTPINRSLLAAQLPRIADQQARSALGARSRGSAYERLARLMSVDGQHRATAMPGADDLRLVVAGLDPLIDALPECARLLEREPELPPGLLDHVETAYRLAHETLGEVRRLGIPQRTEVTSAAAAWLAERYMWSQAAAACLSFWLINRPHGEEFFRKGEWLLACLHQCLAHAGPLPGGDGLLARVGELHRERSTLALFPAPTAPAGSRSAVR